MKVTFELDILEFKPGHVYLVLADPASLNFEGLAKTWEHETQPTEDFNEPEILFIPYKQHSNPPIVIESLEQVEFWVQYIKDRRLKLK